MSCCETVLLFDYETDDYLVFYCMSCHKNVKVNKMANDCEVKGVELKELPCFPDKALDVVDVINDEWDKNTLFIQHVKYLNSVINKRLNG